MAEGLTTKQRDLLRLALLIGEQLVAGNAEAYRVENTAGHILQYADFSTYNVVAQNTSLFISVETESSGPYTYMRRIHKRSLNLTKVHQLNQISRDVTKGALEPAAAIEMLTSSAQNAYAPWQKNAAIIAFILLNAFLLGAGWLEILICLPAAIPVIYMIHLRTAGTLDSMISSFLCCGLVTITGNLAALILPVPIKSDVIIISSILPFMPGIAWTNGVRDIFHADFASGLTKLLEAVVSALSVAFGTAVGLVIVRPQATAAVPHAVRWIPASWEGWVYQLAAATLAVFVFAVFLNAPKSSLFLTALSGCLAWTVYLLLFQNNSTLFTVLISATVISFLSEVFARIYKGPTTIFLIPALYLLVPGVSIYRAVYALIQGLNDDFVYHLNQAFIIGIAIAAAVFIVESCFTLYREFQSTLRRSK